MTHVMAAARLKTGVSVPRLGQGTWRMGEHRDKRADEIAAIQAGLEHGLTLIDTAEMYGDGATERLLGEALANRRDQAFLVSKVYPHNAGRARIAVACENSLKRLRTDRLDLYLLHWRGSVPLAETVEGMEALVAAGKIAAWGVSNFDTDDMLELVAAGGETCTVNQILYNLDERGCEFDLLPTLAASSVVPMAYCPVAQGALLRSESLATLARARDCSPAQMALAWLLQQRDTLVIPKAGTVAHVDENVGALAIELTPDELAALDRDFPPPRRKTRLAML